MAANDFLRLPSGVQVVVQVMLWPAIWAGALLAGAFAGDLIRHTKTRPAAVAPAAAIRR
ncbi:MAG TPA: hypothetical protein VKE96_03885 [Vicinamibacterales bacterium]|nr:hypothetical protein [Vicinamibacterales bacterium]